MPNILAVGIATLDIINTVENYPPENAEIRAIAQRNCRGGNAANTLVILSQLGHPCDWLGVLADDTSSQLITQDFQHFGVNHRQARVYNGRTTPTSYVTLNRRNGSRTIVHYRDLPEYDFDTFKNIDLSPYDWIHFEGRNVDDTARMIAHANACNPSAPISVEIEKNRPGIDKLFPLANYLLFSHQYASQQGMAQPESLLESVKKSTNNAHIICTWGEAGAFALNIDGTFHHSIAFPPKKVIDTLGAGDTFNAGLIHSLANHNDLGTALIDACRLAGQKCGIEGFNLAS
jgi:ketohexokinase